MSFKADIQATRSSDAAVATTLNEGGELSATDTTITLTSATGFPAGGGLIMIEDEVIEYTAVSTNDLLRGVKNGSSPPNFLNDFVYV